MTTLNDKIRHLKKAIPISDEECGRIQAANKIIAEQSLKISIDHATIDMAMRCAVKAMTHYGAGSHVAGKRHLMHAINILRKS